MKTQKQLQRKAAPTQMSNGAEIMRNFFKLFDEYFNREKFIVVKLLGSSLQGHDRQNCIVFCLADIISIKSITTHRS